MNIKPAMKMPEFLVFARIFGVGFLGAEVFRINFYLGANFAQEISEVSLLVKATVILLALTICLIYAIKRSLHRVAGRVGRSYRVDLFLSALIGAYSNELALPWLEKVHTFFKSANPFWAAVILVLFCIVLLSPVVRQWCKPKNQSSPLHFLPDEEIDDENDDLLANNAQAKSFAETVLANGTHSGLIFGVDGPWGVGKTSFINLAEHCWKGAADKVIVCRFEPLRYASEPDLADRLIRDLSAAIQSQVFAPEFRPAASRYSRLIKGKADISFLGFKLLLEPSQETLDDLLEDLDEVLRRIGRRIIIVIDDLDRLDAKTTNNILFATRRTFKLSQATYVLCYDTEVLAGNGEDGARAREFLEKFVTVKLNLLVDSSRLRDFLRRDWARADSQLGSVPSDTMIKLGAVLSELADILDGDLAASYLPLVGDLRKVKRFVNAILLMQIDKTDFGRSDFKERDLINLMLLNLHYPGLFRRIYAEETEGRNGSFSLKREYGQKKFVNTEAFMMLKKELPASACFLLEQLFDAIVLDIDDKDRLEETDLRSRACFNDMGSRNLEAYLKLIVRFVTPEPQETFALYRNAVEQVVGGKSIDLVLTSEDFELTRGEHSHDQFWRVLVNQSYNFNNILAEDAINTLINYLPRYSVYKDDDRGLRSRSIYTLLRLLDNVGWGRTSGRRHPNTDESVIKIAWRLFGTNTHQATGILEQLVSPARGVLGWNDLMLFRLQCSADRQGQLHNLQRALILDQDRTASTFGLVSELALFGMRTLSQKVFALFKKAYIKRSLNFFAEAAEVKVEEILGEAFRTLIDEALMDPQREDTENTVAQRIFAARSLIKSFVIYQLINSLPPTGSGVGCGYYDEDGKGDNGGIAKAMNDYVFGVCFNPEISENNVFLFLDHCLSQLTSPFYTNRDDGEHIATKAGLLGGFDPQQMGSYWKRHRDYILSLNLQANKRRVFTSNYIAFYCDDLAGVFTALDELVAELDASLDSNLINALTPLDPN